MSLLMQFIIEIVSVDTFVILPKLWLYGVYGKNDSEHVSLDQHCSLHVTLLKLLFGLTIERQPSSVIH